MNDTRSSRLARHVTALPKSGIRDFFELVIGMDDVISLGIGEPDFPTPQKIRDVAIQSLQEGRTTYTSNLGLLSLREEICRYLKDEYTLSYDPVKECIITVGVSEALDLAFRAILNPGDEVIYHEPCYVSYRPEIIMAGGVPVLVETQESDDFSLDPEKVERAITPKTKAILLNFPCNPTGATLNAKQIETLAEIAIRHDLIVLTDEIYSELVYEERTRSIAALDGMKDRTIFLHGFSKAFSMTGFRLGYACGPFDIIDTMMKIHQYSMLCAPIIGQYAAIEALRNGKPDRDRMRNEFHRRRDTIVGRLNAMGLHCFKPHGAFYAFPSIKMTGMKSKDFSIALLKERKVAVVPGTAFGACGEGFVRCAYAASMEKINMAMDQIEEFIR